MKKLILILLPFVLMAGCASNPNYAEQLERWQNEQLNAQRQDFTKQLQELGSRIVAKDKELAQLQADKANLSNQVKQLQGQLAAAPKQQEYDHVRGELTAARNSLVDMINKEGEARDRIAMLEGGWSGLTQQLYAAQDNLAELRKKLTFIENKAADVQADNVTFTTAEWKAFYKIWDTLKLLPE